MHSECGTCSAELLYSSIEQQLLQESRGKVSQHTQTVNRLQQLRGGHLWQVGLQSLADTVQEPAGEAEPTNINPDR